MNQSSNKVPPRRVPVLLAQIFAATKEEHKEQMRTWLAKAERDKRGRFLPGVVQFLKAQWNYLYLGDTSSMKEIEAKRSACRRDAKTKVGATKHHIPKEERLCEAMKLS